ncbi:MAG: hypothetical protein V7641_3832 [Blastocatellia bacterium]
MDHEQINQLDLIDRYLMGKLPAEESTGFEEHFVDCPQCIARLQTTNRFLQDLRFVTVEQALQINTRQPRSAFRRFLQRLFHKPLALAIGCLLIAAFAGAVFVNTQRLRTEINQVRGSSEQWQRRYEDERQSAFSTDRKHQETELQLTEQLRALEAKLDDEQAQRARMAAAFSRRMRPEGNLPIFILTSVRGSEPNASEGANKVILPRSSAMFAFSISLEGDLRFENYRIRIFDHRHRLIWKSRRLTPDRYSSLSLGFKSDFFLPGPYSLIVEGDNKEGRWDVVGNYPFLIVNHP